MNLRTAFEWAIGNKPISDALSQMASRINLVWAKEHNGETGLHRFPGTDVPFDPGNFGSTTAGQTWTLVAADQLTYRYVNIGGWVFLLGDFQGVVAGAAGLILTLRLPPPLPGTQQIISGAGWCLDGGVGQALVLSIQDALSPGAMRLLKANLAAWTNGPIDIRFMAFWEMR